MCQFTIALKVSGQDAFDKAKREIEKNGGTFTGNTTSGNFMISIPLAGHLSGTYEMSYDAMTVEITKKPLLISCTRIQSVIEKYLEPEAPVA